MGVAHKDGHSWLWRLVQHRVGRRSRQKQKERQKEREKERIVRLPLGISVALWAPIPSSSRLKRDVLLNAVAALLLFSASDIMAQHLQHTQAHKQQQQSQQELDPQQQQQPPRELQGCGAEQVPPTLSSTLRQIDAGRTLAVGCEGVIVNALLLTPMYHKLEAMLAHNTALKRSSTSSAGGGGSSSRGNPKVTSSGRSGAAARVAAAVSGASTAANTAANAAAAAAAAAQTQQGSRASRLLWLLSLYQVLAVQIVAMPFSSFSFLFFTPVLRFSFTRLFEEQQLPAQEEQVQQHYVQQQRLEQQLLLAPERRQQQRQQQEQEHQQFCLILGSPGSQRTIQNEVIDKDAPTTVQQHQQQQQQGQQQQQHQRCWISSDPPGNLRAALREGYEAVRCHFREIYVASLVVWPLSDLINFRFVPLAMRPAWDSLLDFVWAVYLSYAAHSSPAPVQQQHPVDETAGAAAAAPTSSAGMQLNTA
ncbi:mpv17 / PMP22 family domain-containing protein, putative [Eimeria necatrix]|uniref:Mpv17 / PMP22 family domain-containing protein, putative n=1 Tax=Eimeria necatrix TaxID=51315 RepID=U6MNW2_9EIME|nr:mpv17 / PMP22 family domain-containing protein, putative [Eimeria necatrix]CDJ65912.1 mpv17 / PMP22 family domain-containing protein, putative [Eimeria necatrix]